MEGYLHSFQGCFPYLNILNSVTFITDTTVIVTPTIKQNITHIDFPWPKYCLYQSDLLSSCHTVLKTVTSILKTFRLNNYWFLLFSITEYFGWGGEGITLYCTGGLQLLSSSASLTSASWIASTTGKHCHAHNCKIDQFFDDDPPN
jgi:hypothetical protein